jgi:hypothetical protein
MFGGCKINNVLIIFEDDKVEARGAKTLATSTNSLVHLRAKFHFN